MKNFSKALILLLSFVLIVTVFTVVALADEDGRAAPVCVLEYNFEENEKGDIINDNNTKRGKWTVYVSDNEKNKYLVGEYSTDKGETGGNNNWDINLGTTVAGGTSAYGIQNYPTFAYDFDVMSTSGTYDYDYDAYIIPDIHGANSLDGRLTRMDTIYLKNLGLTSEAYKWSHISIIVKYAGDGVFQRYIYINGVEKTNHTKTIDYKTTKFASQATANSSLINWNDVVDESGELKFDNIRVNYICTYPTQDIANNEGKVAFDNIKYTYYPAGYDVADVVSYYYNTGYDLPYGKTVATVTDSNGEVVEKYDNVANAIAAAGKDETVNLLEDTAATYVINKKVTVQTNGFTFNWTSTDYLSDVNGTVYTFDLAENLYDGLLVNGKDGSKTYFKGHKGFESAIATLISDSGSWPGYVSTITLYNDIEYYKSFTFKRYIDLTIDLNGNTLTRVNVFGTANNYNAETSSYDQTTTTSKVNAFVVPRDVKFTITSSKPGAAFKTISVEGTAYYDAEGFLESYTAASETSIKSAGLFAGSGAPIHSRINFSYIDIYSEMLFSASYGGISDFGFTMTGCRFFKTVGQEAAAYNDAAGDYNRGGIFLNPQRAADVDNYITLTDSLFYIPDSSVKAGNQYYQLLIITGKGAITATFDNCDIIVSNNDGYNLASDSANNTITLNNCRTYGLKSHDASFPATLSGSTVTTSLMTGTAGFASGYTSIDKAQSIIYSFPKTSRATISDGKPVLTFEFEEEAIAFDKKVGLTSELVEISWLDMSGNKLTTTQDFSSSITAPSVKVPSGNGYTAFTNPVWLNSEGKADFKVTDGNYVFTASLPENPEYVAKLEEVLFNMSYLGHFAYRIYVPVVEGVEVTWLGAYSSDNSNFGEVKIDGKPYYVCVAYWMTPTGAFSEKSTTVEFTYAGESFTATIDGLSALVYANLLCDDKSAADVEKDSAIKMVSYVEQVYLSQLEPGKTLSTSLQTSLDTFFTNYNGGSRPTNDKPAAGEIYTVDSSIYNYVSSMQFAIYSNNRMAFLLTLKADAVNAGYKVGVSGIANGFVTPKDSKTGEIIYNSDGSITYYTDNTTLTNGIMYPTYVITITDAEGNLLASTNYNLATYADAVKSDLVYSLYSFGKAAIKSREYLKTL